MENRRWSELRLQISKLSSLISNRVAKTERLICWMKLTGYSLIMLELNFYPLVAERNEHFDTS